MTVVGGTKYGPQIDKLQRGIDVLVATPGRLIDLMERGCARLDNVEFLVLDEADRMLDMGFWPDVQKIVSTTPDTRQTMLFSATISPDIMKNASSILRDPQFVEISHTGETADTVMQYVMPVGRAQKPALLQSLMEQKGGTRILVFTRTKRGADACAKRLNGAHLRADSIHSNKSQNQRERVLSAFKKSKIDILVATDVLARGIDVSEVNYVVNYDLPTNPEDYVHRIGRTGRAGAEGIAYTFVCPDEKAALRSVEKFTKNSIETYNLEGFEYAKAAEGARSRDAKAAEGARSRGAKAAGSSRSRDAKPADGARSRGAKAAGSSRSRGAKAAGSSRSHDAKPAGSSRSRSAKKPAQSRNRQRASVR